MNLDFLGIDIEGFKSFLTKQSLTLGYTTPGLTFVRGQNNIEPDLGANGTGKSTLLVDALGWCLYGRTISGLRTPDLKPWGEKLPPWVAVRLKIDGKAHVIERDAGAGQKLLFDGKETSQEEVERLLGFNINLFSHTIALSQGQPLFFDLTAKDKLQLFSDTLNLVRWEDRSWKAGEAALNLNLDREKLEGELTGAEANLEQLKSLMTKAQALSEEWEKENKDSTKDLEREIEGLRTKLAPLADRKAEASLVHDGVTTELKALEEESDDLNEQVLVAQGEVAKQDIMIRSTSNELTRRKSELKAFGETDNCPICERPLKGTNLAVRKAKLKEEIKKLEVVIKAGVPVKVTHALEVARSKLQAARKHATAFREKAVKARSELDLVTITVAELQTQLRGLEAAKKKQVEQINPHRDQIQNIRRQQKAVEARLDELDTEISIKAKQMERTKYWVKGFKDVRLYIIEEVLQELEMATNALLPESGLHGWAVRYDIEKETKSGTISRGLNVTIESPNNKTPVKWESWSGGESQRLRIVGALALSEVLLSHAGVQTNLEILDEPTQHMSSEGVEDLIEFLALRAQQLNKQIFLIDHKAIESSHFADVITIVKGKSGSIIKLEGA